MNHYKTALIILMTTLALTACEAERVDILKSPCAGIDGSPCGPKRNVNGALNSYPSDHS